MAERAAHAKTNLLLRVLSRDETGFHTLETLFCRLALSDTVRVTPADQLSLALSGPAAEGVPSGADNLCLRAASAFLECHARRYPDRPRRFVHIDLHKRIPAGSGLGGGSADAAAVLRLLNAETEDPLDEADLFRIAGGLGSDVPFALADVAMALGWGRGQRLLPLAPPPPAPVLVVVPPHRVSTADAYGWLARTRLEETEGAAAARLPDPTELSRWSALSRLARNDFDPIVGARFPESVACLSALRGPGARAALLSGSGSALIAFYESEAARAEAEDRVVRAGLDRQRGWRRLGTSGPV